MKLFTIIIALLLSGCADVYIEDRSSPSGIEYVCIYESEQDFIDVTYEGVHYEHQD